MAKAKVTAKVSALDEYRQAVSTDPKNAEAHTNLGWGLYSAGQAEEAIKEFNEALRLDSAQVDALYGLALTRKSAGAKPEAVAAFDRTLALLPKLEDKTRGNMLRRLARGHVNMLQSGSWKLPSLLGQD